MVRDMHGKTFLSFQMRFLREDQWRQAALAFTSMRQFSEKGALTAYTKRRMILNQLKAPGSNQVSLLRKTGCKRACNCCHKEWHCVMPVLRFC